MFSELPANVRIDQDLIELLSRRTRALRVSATETVDPLIPSLEAHGRLLRDLFGRTPAALQQVIGRMAAEIAWLAANAHSDNSDDQRSLHWSATAARIAREIDDHDLRAHAISRMSRTYLSLRDPSRAIAVLNEVDLSRVSPYGRARIEVHRALSSARLGRETPGFRTRHALDALDAAKCALLGSPGRSPRPSWVWWRDDEGFLKSWEAEVLRSLVVPTLAVPAFRSAITATSLEDSREIPFLQAGLAEVISQRGDIDEAAHEAIRAIILARAVQADAALDRVRTLCRGLTEQAPDNRHVRSLREALGS